MSTSELIKEIDRVRSDIADYYHTGLKEDAKELEEIYFNLLHEYFEKTTD